MKTNAFGIRSKQGIEKHQIPNRRKGITADKSNQHIHEQAKRSTGFALNQMIIHSSKIGLRKESSIRWRLRRSFLRLHLHPKSLLDVTRQFSIPTRDIPGPCLNA